MLTEQQNPQSLHIDQLSTLEILQVINNEDKSVAFAVEMALPAIAEAVNGIVARLRDGGRLFYVGAGTSGRLGVLDAVECVPTYSTPSEMVQGIIAGGDAALTQSVEGAEDDPAAARADLQGKHLTAKDVVVGIAASGRTPYVSGAVEYGNEIGALTVGVACNAPSPLLEAAQIAIGVLVGPEVVTGSTRMKAGTAQKLVLNMLSTATMIKLGKVYGNLMVDVQVKNQKLEDRARRIIAQITDVDYQRAAVLLNEANNNVKVAIVMQLLGLSSDEAAKRLQARQGILRDVLEEGQSHD